MNWNNILTVYGKELRDMLRDRRTLISMIVIPTFAMPGLFALVVAVSFQVQREVASTPPSIMILGGDDSPETRDALLRNDRITVQPAGKDWKQLISDKKLRAAVELPPGLDAALARGESVAIKIYNYEGEVRSDRAVREVRNFFNARSEKIVTARLADRGLTPATIKPLEVKAENVAPPEKVGGNLIGGIIPYFFLILAFTGAMYPAMDLTAGEKERGTMETLLCSPVGRVDIVLGKFLMILTASLGTVACSLISMGLTFTIGGSIIAQRVGGGGGPASAAKAAEKFSSMITLDPLGMVAVLGMVLPMVVLFSAALFTISLFAKSFKEAQSYVSPLIVVILMPAMIGMLPGVELNWRLALVPILNVSLASKELVSGVWHWDLLGLIFASTCGYAALALAVRMFNREDVIFRT
ncbi:MAG: ABC transporter permease [Opitutus sp.]|nr:ABC transporter permease [Opitutus sp.]